MTYNVVVLVLGLDRRDRHLWQWGFLGWSGERQREYCESSTKMSRAERVSRIEALRRWSGLMKNESRDMRVLSITLSFSGNMPEGGGRAQSWPGTCCPGLYAWASERRAFSFGPAIRKSPSEGATSRGRGHSSGSLHSP